ncbi:MAG: FAD-dependent oxidoreductase, partial [Anaerolineae bacterium]|nr:FAD-dependent oxidoreductase [Anaerolineae bacterium]
LEGVYEATEYLVRGNLPPEALPERLRAPLPPARRVVVIGGGDTSMDCVRTARRLGAEEVTCMYRRTEAEMLGRAEERKNAKEEGVHFLWMTIPLRLVGENGKVTGVECQAQELGPFDESGRRRPVPLEGSEFLIPAEVVIPAVGQGVDLSCLNGDAPETNRDSTFRVNEHLATSRDGVFAAGDAVLGPATVIEAVAQGNQVALAVDAYLRGKPVVNARQMVPYRTAELTYSMDDYAEARRAQMPMQEPAARAHNFDEVELGFDEETARNEARRCLRCDLEYEEYMASQRAEEN